MSLNATEHSVAVIGAGPAGLMAAEVLVQGGVRVDVYDRMPSVGRKLLMAGKGGLNITHTDSRDAFLSRYGSGRAYLETIISQFDADALCAWVHGLGIRTFVGTSGRVFPDEMKAAPLLRAWLHRLREAGVKIHVRHRWCGWEDDGALRFETAHGRHTERHDAVVLALGGASWPQLGSDGDWTRLMQARGVTVSNLRPSNCGFDVDWSNHFSSRFNGQPVKAVTASFTDHTGATHRKQGEFIVTTSGVEGGLIYALSAMLRDRIETSGAAVLDLDLAPGRDLSRLTEALAHPRGSRSLSSHIQSRTGIKGVKMGMLREVLGAEHIAEPQALASAMKALPLRLVRPRPLAEAISTAGGVAFESMDKNLMLRSLPGVFCAGEMLDWEAPTGGYLLNACLATGRTAGAGALEWLSSRDTS
ncbi:MAG: TIGR03862 family flavoprotein [Burkholderiales bacterium]